MSFVDHPETPKLWAIAHKNGHTCKNNKFFLSFLSRMYILSYSLYISRTPKQWAIAHENSPKTQK
jgi:hypothetical protein